LLRDERDADWRRPISDGFTLLHSVEGVWKTQLQTSVAGEQQDKLRSIEAARPSKHPAPRQTHILMPEALQWQWYAVLDQFWTRQRATHKMGKPHNVGHKWHNAHSTQQDMFATTI
jgi:hypothetical protein